jgi:hypothetical protein
MAVSASGRTGAVHRRLQEPVTILRKRLPAALMERNPEDGRWRRPARGVPLLPLV